MSLEKIKQVLDESLKSSLVPCDLDQLGQRLVMGKKVGSWEENNPLYIQLLAQIKSEQLRLRDALEKSKK